MGHPAVDSKHMRSIGVVFVLGTKCTSAATEKELACGILMFSGVVDSFASASNIRSCVFLLWLPLSKSNACSVTEEAWKAGTGSIAAMSHAMTRVAAQRLSVG